MGKSEVTREAYPAFFSLRDAIKRRYHRLIYVTVEPFDQYQGPYVSVDRRVRIWAGQPFHPYGVRNMWVVEHRNIKTEVKSGNGVYKILDKIFTRK